MGATDRSFARIRRALAGCVRASHDRSGRQHRSQGGRGGSSRSSRVRPRIRPRRERRPPPSPRPRPRIAREKRLRRLSGRSARVPRARDRARAVPRRPEVRAARASRLARTSDRPARRWRASRRPRTTGRRRMVQEDGGCENRSRGRGLPLLPRTSQPRDGAEGAAGETLRGGGCRALREARGLGGLRSLVLEHRGHLGGTPHTKWAEARGTGSCSRGNGRRPNRVGRARDRAVEA